MLEGWVGAIVSVFLVLLSGLFSGLSLAWMNSDRDRLEVLKNGGTQEQQRYANAVVPVRVGQANQLLVALLLTNVVVNAGLTAVLIAVTSVPIGFGIASALILLFGELIPQLFVSRHALVTAAKTLWLVKLIIVLTLFINWPLGKVIDWLVGEEVSHYMTKDEIRELVHRGKDVEMNAAKIMTGALNLHEKQAKDVMTSLKDVYRLEVNEKLDTNTLLTVFNSGYSRIPCYDSKRRSDPTIGLLFVKDLILLDPKDAIPLNTVLKLYGRDVIQVFPDTPLDKMLELFKTGKSHLAIVHDVNDQGDGDPFYEEIGIITLEDIIETILQDNIVDETDVYINVAADKKELTNRKLPDVSALHGLSRRQLPNVLTPQELSAVYFHLRGNIAIFKPNDSSGCLLSSKALKKMLGVSQVIHVNIEQHKKKEAGGKSEVSQSAANARIIDIARGGDYICVKGRPTDCMTVILEGRAQVIAGRDGFVTEAGKWAVLCPMVFDGIKWAADEAAADAAAADGGRILEPSAFVPDFSARLTSNARVMRVTRDQFIKAMRATRYPQIIQETELNKPEDSVDMTSQIGDEKVTSIDSKERKAHSPLSKAELHV